MKTSDYMSIFWYTLGQNKAAKSAVSNLIEALDAADDVRAEFALRDITAMIEKIRAQGAVSGELRDQAILDGALNIDGSPAAISGFDSETARLVRETVAAVQEHARAFEADLEKAAKLERILAILVEEEPVAA